MNIIVNLQLTQALFKWHRQPRENYNNATGMIQRFDLLVDCMWGCEKFVRSAIVGKLGCDYG